MDSNYKIKMSEELAFYHGSFKAFILSYISYKQYKFVKLLRLVEYYGKRSDWFSKILVGVYKYRLRKYELALGYQIPPYTIGWGLKIYHFGPIIINSKAKLGENCTLYPGVNVGKSHSGVPNIGNNCILYLCILARSL